MVCLYICELGKKDKCSMLWQLISLDQYYKDYNCVISCCKDTKEYIT